MNYRTRHRLMTLARRHTPATAHAIKENAKMTAARKIDALNTARTIAQELGQNPDAKGTARLAQSLSDMPADSIAERNNHLEHCRNKVAGWCMRDVLDFLNERCETVEDYRMSASVCEMNAVDARNRERAALFMAGRAAIAKATNG